MYNRIKEDDSFLVQGKIREGKMWEKSHRYDTFEKVKEISTGTH